MFLSRGSVILLALASTLALPQCGGARSPDVNASPAPVVLSSEQKLRALRLISVFENDTPELQFAYVSALGDGRGFTCGLGFTTATGDAYRAAAAYTERKPANPLAPFLPRLKALAEEESGDTEGLSGFSEAWKQAAGDPDFQAIQTKQTDIDSYEPALALAHALGLTTVLSAVVLYDTVWMHGDGDDLDGTKALIARASERARVADEPAWLAAFLEVRRATLLNPANAATQAEWSMAVTRIDALGDLLAARNFEFRGPIYVGHGHDHTVP